MSNRTLGDLLDTQQNSFNAVRLLAASAVFISHSFLLLPYGRYPEPFDGAAYNLGQIAVNVFFFLSGMMLARSYALRPDLPRFVMARALRIFPGLIVCGAVAAWLIGPLNTTLPLDEYFSSPETLAYPFLVPLQFNAATLPGVFAFGTEPGAVNVPLWTIKYELIAYAAFIALSATGLWPKGRRAFIVAGLLGLALAITTSMNAFETSSIGSLLRFGFCFAIGHLAYTQRERIRLDLGWTVLGIAISVPLLFTPLGAVASILSVSYLAAVLGGLSFGALGRWSRSTDNSYGIYLYAWPIQQMFISRFAHNHIEALGLAVFAALLTIIFAWLSWTLIERPSLSLKSRKRLQKAAAPAN